MAEEWPSLGGGGMGMGVGLGSGMGMGHSMGMGMAMGERAGTLRQAARGSSVSASRVMLVWCRMLFLCCVWCMLLHLVLKTALCMVLAMCRF